MTNTPIEALVIQPDATYRTQTIAQDIPTIREAVGGYVQAVQTEHCVFWVDEDGKPRDLPINPMATYLWWKVQPEMESIDSFNGTVVVTGPINPTTEAIGNIPASVLDLYRRMEDLRLCDEDQDQDSEEAPSP